MRKAFTGLAALLVLVLVAQFFFAALGGFSTDPQRAAYRPHHALGYVIFSVPVVMAIVGAIARLPRRLIGLSALVAGLTTLQVLLGSLARSLGDTGGGLVFGLHGINGLAIMAVSVGILRQCPHWTALGRRS
jgi:hypothetical protein